MSVTDTSAGPIATPERNWRPDMGAIWISGLHSDTTMSELAAHFEKAGVVIQAQILRTAKSPQPFAFIWFDKKESAKEALTLDGSTLKDQQIKIRFKRQRRAQ